MSPLTRAQTFSRPSRPANQNISPITFCRALGCSLGGLGGEAARPPTSSGVEMTTAKPTAEPCFDLEPKFVCQACGRRGADVRPDFNWDKCPAGGMGCRALV
jgi:hypothetical protein